MGMEKIESSKYWNKIQHDRIADTFHLKNQIKMWAEPLEYGISILVSATALKVAQRTESVWVEILININLNISRFRPVPREGCL